MLEKGYFAPKPAVAARPVRTAHRLGTRYGASGQTFRPSSCPVPAAERRTEMQRKQERALPAALISASTCSGQAPKRVHAAYLPGGKILRQRLPMRQFSLAVSRNLRLESFALFVCGVLWSDALESRPQTGSRCCQRRLGLCGSPPFPLACVAGRHIMGCKILQTLILARCSPRRRLSLRSACTFV